MNKATYSDSTEKRHGETTNVAQAITTHVLVLAITQNEASLRRLDTWHSKSI